jgi:hypothetical protein
MKQSFIVIFFLFIFGAINAQEIPSSQIPRDVMDRLHHAFPQSLDLPVKWTREKLDYKASLTIMDEPAYVVIDSTGRQKRLERRINDVYLPDAAKQHMKSIDPKHQIISVYKVVDDKENVTYKTTARIITTVNFDAKGKVITK